MTDKYRFTGETKHLFKKLYRIQRLSDGKVGGWIEKEENLSHEGNCWVDDEAIVCDSTRVYGNARVSGNAQISGRACISGNAQVFDNASINYRAQVYGDAKVKESARVEYYARVGGTAVVKGKALITNETRISDGEWNRSPLAIYLPHGIINHSGPKRISLVFSNRSSMNLKCEDREGFEKFLVSHGLSEIEVKETMGSYDLIMKIDKELFE